MKRTALAPGVVPLARRTPIARNHDRNAPRKGRAAGTASGQPKPPPRFTAKVRLQIRTRAGKGDPSEARCEAHGDFLGERRGEFQHRRARGMGGSRNPVTNSAANGTLLCPPGHRVCESRDEDMHAQGFWLEQWQDPRTESVMLHGAGSGITIWLAQDGTGPDGDGYLRQPPVLERAA